MKKHGLIILLAALASMAFTSCLKENDLDGLRHPIHIVGDFNPELGVPIGADEMSIEDLLGLFSETKAYVSLNEQDLVTLHYDTMLHFGIPFDTLAYGKGRAKSADSVYYKDVAGEMDIDIFESITQVDLNTITLQNIFTDLVAHLQVMGSPRSLGLIDEYNVRCSFDHIELEAIGPRGNMVLPLSTETIQVDNFVRGRDSVTLLRNTDISNIFNVLPNKVRYSARINLVVPGRVFEEFNNISQFVKDSLEIDSLSIDLDCGVRSPLSLSVANLSYALSTPFAVPDDIIVQMEDNGLTLDTASLVLEFDNHLPLGFDLEISMVDTLTGDSLYLFDQEPARLAPAQVAYNPATNSYLASQSQRATISIPLNQERLNAMAGESILKVKATVATSPHDNGYPVVSIQGHDALHLRVYLRIAPNVHLDIPLAN